MNPPDSPAAAPASDLIALPEAVDAAKVREEFLRALAASIFLLFFQTYMVAPLIPFLAISFHVSQQMVGLLVPAYTLPYAMGGLVCGTLADRWGRRGLLFFSLAGFPALSLLLAAAPTMQTLIAFRVATGLANAGIAVMGLTLVGDLFPTSDRGRALGWVFGAIAGGGAFGSTLGGLLAPLIGWRGLFIFTGILGLLLFLRMLRLWATLAVELPAPMPAWAVLKGYFGLATTPRGGRTYGGILFNAAFHSGVFTWLGVHLHDRYGLGEAGIGLALLGYGVPGFVLGPMIGRVVDRHGRRLLIPVGFLTAALAAAIYVPRTPLLVAVIAAAILSLGFDLTHPLLAGISTMLDGRRRGQAMGLNSFAIFFGFGVGSLLFGWLARNGTAHAMAIFAAGQATFGIAAFFLYRSE